MRQKLKLKRPRLSPEEFSRRARGFLEQIQKNLMPEHAKEVVAINMETGEHVLGQDSDEALEAFLQRWPDVLAYICRVDGSASTKFHGI